MKAVGLAVAAWLVAAAAPFDSAQVVFLGEAHDNPAHHARQAGLVAELAPAAIVWEMLTPDQSYAVTPSLIAEGVEAMDTRLNWSESGWPDFAMYYPIFAAAPGALHLGAQVPRPEARRLMDEDAAAVFGAEAARFGLDAPLPADQQTAREAMQMAAHCDALPETMLPMMVEMQRLRDARLAQVALNALERTGGPVVVITGNGHARTDWGAPFLLAHAAPDVITLSLGQGEETTGDPQGTFDVIEITAGVERGDPCDAFR